MSIVTDGRDIDHSFLDNVVLTRFVFLPNKDVRSTSAEPGYVAASATITRRAAANQKTAADGNRKQQRKWSLF